MKEIKPDQQKETEKKEQVREMFDQIAPTYDFLNRFLSLRNDVTWRKKLIGTLSDKSPQVLLDIATGTGDVAFEAIKRISPQKVIGLDLSNQMLEVARRKAKQLGSNVPIEFIQGDSEALPFENNSINCVTVAFGVRNFGNMERGLQEIFRVLKTGGQVSILEFTNPVKFPIKQAYRIYFKFILPLIGRIKSGDPNAYTYLFKSVQNFPQYEEFTRVLSDIGFSDLFYKPLTFGICTIYVGKKALS